MLISFKKIAGGYTPCTPLAHYVSLGTIPNIIQTLTPLFKKLDPPLIIYIYIFELRKYM